MDNKDIGIEKRLGRYQLMYIVSRRLDALSDNILNWSLDIFGVVISGQNNIKMLPTSSPQSKYRCYIFCILELPYGQNFEFFSRADVLIAVA